MKNNYNYRRITNAFRLRCCCAVKSARGRETFLQNHLLTIKNVWFRLAVVWGTGGQFMRAVCIVDSPGVDMSCFLERYLHLIDGISLITPSASGGSREEKFWNCSSLINTRLISNFYVNLGCLSEHSNEIKKVFKLESCFFPRACGHTPVERRVKWTALSLSFFFYFSP